MSPVQKRKLAQILISLDKWMGVGLTPEQKSRIYTCYPDVRPLTKKQMTKVKAKRASPRI